MSYLCSRIMRKITIYIFLILFFMILTSDVFSQCAMCKAVVESGLGHKEHVEIGKGINQGIYFLIGIPYMLLSILGYTIYRNRKITEI